MKYEKNFEIKRSNNSTNSFREIHNQKIIKKNAKNQPTTYSLRNILMSSNNPKKVLKKQSIQMNNEDKSFSIEKVKKSSKIRKIINIFIEDSTF